MKIINVCSSLDLRSGGGTAERTFQMSLSLANSGSECTVLTLNIGLDSERLEALKPAKVVVLDCLWKRFYLPKICWKKVYQLIDDADVVHLIGHWGLLNVFAYLVARKTRKPYVVCPAGALPYFGRSIFLKRLYNFFVGNAIIRNAAGWIAVTSSELTHFASYGIPPKCVKIIPNGVNERDFPPFDRNMFLQEQGLKDAPIILFMGRLNQIKGPDLLLDAFASVADILLDYQLIFAGSDGGMLTDLRLKVGQLGLCHRVHFLGHLDGEVKSGAYRAARLLVVPSRQEAMSIVALEAGACGTPVLLTNQCGFNEIKKIDKRLEVPATIDAIANGLISLLADPMVLEDINTAWKFFVMNNYEWKKIAPRYLCYYSQILRCNVLC
jgi:glycosyltransferase involved in cell wall biosynthesis